MLKHFLKAIENGTLELELGGFFNVEGGSFQLSSGLYADCDACNYGRNASRVWSCAKCGRNSENTLIAKSGDGDGVYTTWKIWHPQDEWHIGFIAFFDSSYSVANACRSSLEEKGSAPNFESQVSPLLRAFSNTKRVVRGIMSGEDSLNIGGSHFGIDMNQPFLDFYIRGERFVASLFVEEPGEHSGDYGNDVEHKPRALLLLNEEYTEMAGPEEIQSDSIEWAEEELKSLMVLEASHLESMAETIPSMNFLVHYTKIDRDGDLLVDEDIDLEYAASWAMFEWLVNENWNLVDVMLEEEWDFSQSDVQDILACRGLAVSAEELDIDLLGFQPQKSLERANRNLPEGESSSSGLSKASSAGLSNSGSKRLASSPNQGEPRSDSHVPRAIPNKFCHECGSELPGAVKFCPSCGTKQS